MKTKRHIPGWVIIILVLAVASVAIITIVTLRQHADESHQSIVLLSRLEVLSNQLDTLEWRFERIPDPKTLQNVQVIENQIAQTLDGLMRLDPGDEGLQQIRKTQLEFEISMDEMFRLIAAGDLKKAYTLDSERIDPTFDALSEIIANTSSTYNERAQQANRASNIGTILVMIVAGAIIGILGLQFQKIQLKAELAAAEQKMLRKAHDELEIRVRDRTDELTRANEALQTGISEHKRTEEKLSEREHFLDSVFTSIQDGIGIIDKDMNILRVNPIVEKWYPHAMPLVGKKCYEAYHSQNERCEDCPASRTLRTGESIYGIKRKSGHGGEYVGWVEIYSFPMLDTTTGEMKGAIEYVRDITERIQAEEEKDRLLKAVASSTEGIGIIDKNDRFIYVNAALAKIYDYSQEELIGKTWKELTTPEVITQAENALADTLHNKDVGVFSGEFFDKRKDGTLIPVDVMATSLWDEEGNYSGHICTIRDITKRKQTEASLRLFSEAIEEASNGIQIVDLGGHIIYSNKAIEEIYGFSPAEFKGKHVNEMNIDPEFAGQVILPGIKETGRWAGELMVKHKDGHVFPILLTASIVKDSKSEPIAMVGIITDITERKRMEEELQKSISQQNAILTNISDIAWLKDKESRFIAVNKPFAEACGVNSEELIGKTDLDIWPKELAEVYRADDREVMATGRRKQVEEPLVDKEGKKTWIETIKTPIYDDKGKIIGTTGISRDITERKRMAEVLQKAHDELEMRVQERTAELKQSEEKYHTLVDNIQDGVFIVQDAKIQFANEAFAKMVGYTVDGVTGKVIWELAAPEDLETVTDRYNRRMAGEDVLREYEFRMLHKDGRARVLVNMNVGLITYNGRVASMGTMKNITEKKKLEAQLLRAQRMESIGTLAGGIAHDLNNVLTPMMLSLQILQEKFTDEQSQKLINILETNTQRGANLIKQVMSFARGAEGEHVTLQIADIVSEIKKILNETLPRSIDIRTDIPGNLWMISGDGTQLHQVLMNLCVNARDAMPNGGILGIYAENIFIDENYVRLNIEAKVGPYIIITVSDTGTGIPPEILGRIFEPFFTTKEFGKGTGLGLSTALGIIKGHGGFIDVYSEVGKGTAFKIYLPALKTTAMQKAEIQQHELPGGHGELIFIVDDEARILDITKSILEKHGYRVLTASDGAEAIRLYSQNIEEIKVVIMDMMMPTMDGPASIQALHRINPDIKIVGVSGLTERDKIMRAVDADIYTFLTKPYTAEMLLRTIHEVLSAPPPHNI